MNDGTAAVNDTEPPLDGGKKKQKTIHVTAQLDLDDWAGKRHVQTEQRGNHPTSGIVHRRLPRSTYVCSRYGELLS